MSFSDTDPSLQVLAPTPPTPMSVLESGESEARPLSPVPKAGEEEGRFTGPATDS